MPVTTTRTVDGDNVTYSIEITALQSKADVLAAEASEAIYNDNSQWWVYTGDPPTKVEWADLTNIQKRYALGYFARLALVRMAHSLYRQTEIESTEAGLDDPDDRYGGE